MEAPNHREIPPKKTVSRKIIAFITFQFLFLYVFNVVNITVTYWNTWVVFFLDVRVPIHWVHAYALGKCLRVHMRNGKGAYPGAKEPTRVPPRISLLDGHIPGKWLLCIQRSAYLTLPMQQNYKWLSRMPAHAYADYKMKSGLHELTVWGNKSQEESSRSPGLTNRLLCRRVVHCRCCGRIGIIVWMSVYDQSAEDEDNDDDEQEWWWP